MHISYKDHITNEIVCTKMQTAIGPYEDLLTTVKQRKLRWFGHVTRSSGLCKKVLQGTLPGKGKREDKRKDGKTTSKSGPFSTSTAVREQPRTVRDRRRFRRCQQWCPYDPDGSGTQVTYVLRAFGT